MLMDDLLAVRGPGASRVRMIGSLQMPSDVAEGFSDHFAYLQDGVRKAERVVVDDASVAAIANLEVNDLFGIGENIELARPPFKCLWIEWANANRGEMLDANGVKGWMPKRSGYLLERDPNDPSRFVAWPVIQKRSMEDVIAFPQGIEIDLNKAGLLPPPSVDDLKDFASELVEANAFNSTYNPSAMKLLSGSSRAAEARRVAISRIANVMLPVIKPEGEALYEWLGEEEEEGDQPEVAAKALSDIRGELFNDLRFLLAALLTLNTRNFFTLGPGADLSKQNKTRLKHGKAPFLEHHTLRILPSRVQASRGVEGGGTKKRFHHCRGHLKRRVGRDGSVRLLWWSDHWRGDMVRGTVRKTYVL